MEHFNIDRTDEEREELIKQWIKSYWLAVVIAVFVAVAAVYGIDYFKKNKIKSLDKAALQVQLLNQAILANKVNEAELIVSSLQDKEKHTSFSALATLSLAKKYFNDESYDKAIEQYNWLIKQSADMAMRDLARLRKARCQANAKQITEAITTLNGFEGQNIASANLLKGDILMTDKQFRKAKEIYNSLLANERMSKIVEQRLQLLNIKQQLK